MRAWLGLLGLLGASAPDESLIFDRPACAGIGGFRALWDWSVPVAEDGLVEVRDPVVQDRGQTAVWSPDRLKPGQAGPFVFDAVQRCLLVRFPGAAERIAEELKRGRSVAKVEMVLPFLDEELWAPGGPDYVGPDGYNYRMNWGVDEMYRKQRPNWHAVAWAIRKPWTRGGEGGPTWNAWAPGGFWVHCGAQDEAHDRFPVRFGPAEISFRKPEGRLDVTAVVKDPAFGADLGARLRVLSDGGFLLRKWETYDHRYYNGAYEWATGTGGRGLRIRTPRLVVTFQAGNGETVNLPPPWDPARLKGGEPTALLPSREPLAALAAKEAARPPWMPSWQWERVQELKRLAGNPDEPFWYEYVPGHIRGRVEGMAKSRQIPPEEVPREIFGRWVDGLIGRPPRGWYGFEAAREMTQWYRHGEALPLPARDAVIAYWTAWLMPDRPAAESEKLRRDPNYTAGPLVHPMADDPRVGGPNAKNPDPANGRFDTYYAATGDWRGNKSFYRSGFCYTMSTQNFNTTASAGALLGGSIIGSAEALKDGRHGVEHFPLRLWAWSNGSGQEHVDHYYYAITLSGYKAIRDFGPTPYDRLLGESLLAKGIEELVSCWHPGLRRFIAGSSRTSLEYLLVTQDGLQHIMHTLSKRGALHDLDGAKLPGHMKAFGHEVPAGVVARQTLSGPWAPAWVANLVDEKPLPFEAVHRADRSWRHCFLGRHYGLFSADTLEQRIQVMAHWKRADRPVERYTDLVTMNLRAGANQTRWANDAHGWIAPIGKQAALQHRGKLVFVGSPWPSDHLKNVLRKEGLRSLQNSLALFNYQSPPSWEITVDGRRVDRLPFAAKAGQRILVRDGVTYLAVVPLPATDLGRDEEVVLEEGREQEFGGVAVKPAIVIHAYHLRRAEPSKGEGDLGTLDRAIGGFYVELADAAEFPDFEAFRRHAASLRVEARTEAEKDLYHVRVASGKDVLECGVFARWGSGAPEAFAYRRVNGAEPYSHGLDRDTPVSVAGRTGRLEKNGAVLTGEKGRMAFLQADPVSGTVAAFNPLPDPAPFALSVPGGVTVRADGLLGLARVVVCPKERTLVVDHALREDQRTLPGMARRLIVSGMANPAVTFNGRPAALRDGTLLLAEGER